MMSGQRGRAVAAVEHQKDHASARSVASSGNQPRSLLLRLELPFQRGEVALGQRPGGQLGANVGDHLRHVTAVGIGREDDAAA